MEWTEKKLDVAGLEVAAKIWGSEQGRPVLALHGWLDNAATFDALVPLLGDGLQIAAIDLPGHGRSQGRDEVDAYHFIDWVAVVSGAADALGWERFSILGHSMGAAIATLVAPVARQRVRQMVLLDGIGPWSAPDEEVVDGLREALGQEKLLAHKQRRRYESVDEMLDAMSKARSDVSNERLRLLVARGASRGNDGMWRMSYDLKLKAKSRIRLTEKQVIAFLKAIECPVLLVRPRWGWPVEESIIERRLEAIDELELLEIEGGHHVHLEEPERLADAVRTFLVAK